MQRSALAGHVRTRRKETFEPEQREGSQSEDAVFRGTLTQPPPEAVIAHALNYKCENSHVEHFAGLYAASNQSRCSAVATPYPIPPASHAGRHLIGLVKVFGGGPELPTGGDIGCTSGTVCTRF